MGDVGRRGHCLDGAVTKEVANLSRRAFVLAQALWHTPWAAGTIPLVKNGAFNWTTPDLSSSQS